MIKKQTTGKNELADPLSQQVSPDFEAMLEQARQTAPIEVPQEAPSPQMAPAQSQPQQTQMQSPSPVPQQAQPQQSPQAPVKPLDHLNEIEDDHLNDLVSPSSASSPTPQEQNQVEILLKGGTIGPGDKLNKGGQIIDKGIRWIESKLNIENTDQFDKRMDLRAQDILSKGGNPQDVKLDYATQFLKLAGQDTAELLPYLYTPGGAGFLVPAVKFGGMLAVSKLAKDLLSPEGMTKEGNKEAVKRGIIGGGFDLALRGVTKGAAPFIEAGAERAMETKVAKKTLGELSDTKTKLSYSTTKAIQDLQNKLDVTKINSEIRLGKYTKDIVDKIDNYFPNVERGIDDMISQVQNGLREGADELVSQVTTAIPKVTNSISNDYDNFFKGSPDKIVNLKEPLKGVMDTLIEVPESVIPKLPPGYENIKLSPAQNKELLRGMESSMESAKAEASTKFMNRLLNNVSPKTKNEIKGAVDKLFLNEDPMVTAFEAHKFKQALWQAGNRLEKNPAAHETASAFKDAARAVEDSIGDIMGDGYKGLTNKWREMKEISKLTEKIGESHTVFGETIMDKVPQAVDELKKMVQGEMPLETDFVKSQSLKVRALFSTEQLLRKNGLINEADKMKNTFKGIIDFSDHEKRLINDKKIISNDLAKEEVKLRDIKARFEDLTSHEIEDLKFTISKIKTQKAKENLDIVNKAIELRPIANRYGDADADRIADYIVTNAVSQVTGYGIGSKMKSILSFKNLFDHGALSAVDAKNGINALLPSLQRASKIYSPVIKKATTDFVYGILSRIGDDNSQEEGAK